MKITVEEVQHTAKLAKLKFTEEEAEKIAKELETILAHFKSMDEIECNDLRPVEKEETKTVLRKDEVVVFKVNNKLLQNTIKLQDGYVQVPRIIE